MKNWLVILIIGVFGLLSEYSYSQLHGSNWIISDGYNNTYSNIKLSFLPGQAPQQVQTGTYIPIDRTNASISDAWGNLLFFTNGIYVFDRNLDTIGPPLHPSSYTSSWAIGGLNLPKGAVFLPDPGDTNRFYLFHVTNDAPYIPPGHPQFFGLSQPGHLFYTVVDKQLNNGNGGVVSINNILLTDTLAYRQAAISVTKHANGRDWWILVKKHYKNKYYKYLLTPAGIQNMGFQNIGPNNTPAPFLNGGFSPDGQYLCQVIDDYAFSFLRFDRCTGVLSDYQSIMGPVFINNTAGSLTYSANSSYVYFSYGRTVFQLDLTQASVPGGLQNSLQVVAICDSSYICPGSTNQYMSYVYGQEALDGKIYFSNNFSGCNFFSSVDSPNVGGVGCQVNNFSIFFSTSGVGGGMPYTPNYMLGSIPGSICDSLTVGIAENTWQGGEVKIYPQPAGEELVLESSLPLKDVSIGIFDLQGALLDTYYFSEWTTFTINLKQFESGIYLADIQSRDSRYPGRLFKKVLVQH